LTRSRLDVTASVCVVGWTVGALAARKVGLWPAMGTTAVVLGAATLLFAYAELAPLLRPRARELPIGLAAGAVMLVATYALFDLLVPLAPTLFGDTTGLYAEFRTLRWWTAVALLVPVICGEELVWRGCVQSAIAARTSPRSAALFTPIVYAAAHVPLGSPVLVLTALGGGVLWSLLRTFTNGVCAPIVAHFVWDLVILSIHPLA